MHGKRCINLIPKTYIFTHLCLQHTLNPCIVVIVLSELANFSAASESSTWKEESTPRTSYCKGRRNKITQRNSIGTQTKIPRTESALNKADPRVLFWLRISTGLFCPPRKPTRNQFLSCPGSSPHQNSKNVNNSSHLLSQKHRKLFWKCTKQTPWPESESELYRRSDRHLSE
jgi:hypothetical protein